MTTERFQGNGERVLSISELREIRKQNRITQGDLAEKLGIKRGILSAIETRKANPTVPLDEFSQQYLQGMQQVIEDKIQTLRASRNRLK